MELSIDWDAYEWALSWGYTKKPERAFAFGAYYARFKDELPNRSDAYNAFDPHYRTR